MVVENTGLPVEASIDALRNALREQRRVVLAAEPGAGKTTVVPLRLLDEPWLAGRKVVMLEPRRIAARAAAQRLAHLYGEPVGETVGVVTRDDRRVSGRTRLEVVTEGILTRRLQRDGTLDGVGLVIFDEFHERSLQADLGLALTLDAIETLELDVGVVVMSATIDTDRVAALIGNDQPAPVVTSEGRTYPIEVIWRPRNKKDWVEPATASAIQWALDASPDGNILTFLPGIAEIRRTADALRPGPGVDVRMLHGSLPGPEQDAAIAPSEPGRRKVVLSTDIAETSLTVDGISVVVDAGLSRRPQHDQRTGMTRLVTVSNSRASADQRAGRAGRLGPGTAIRLWSKIEHSTREAYDPPEMAEVDLAGLAVELLQWGSSADSLRFLDPPRRRALDEAHELLVMLGAITDRDDARALTSLGREMANLPVHPRLARMLVGGRDLGLGWMACLLAALLDERDVLRGKPSELPSDLELRLDLLVDHTRRHPNAAGRSIANARDRAHDLARRLGATRGPVDSTAAGAVLALAYPDRIGQQRSGRGRFRLRNGSGAWVPETDPLAASPLVVAADLDGRRKDARIRMGAALSADDLMLNFSADIDISSGLVWDKGRNDLIVRTRRQLGSLDLGTVDDRPVAGDETTAALLDRVRSSRLKMLTWTETATSTRARLDFLHRRLGDSWPAVDDETLLGSLDEWLAPFLPGATGRADIEMVSIAGALEALLSHEQRQSFTRLVPARHALPSGRKVPIDWTRSTPTIRAKVQEFYGSTDSPTVLDGAVTIALELLSPADRPIQITSDLAGFWSGSWVEVRKEMAGRYPKHDWPVDPTARS